MNDRNVACDQDNACLGVVAGDRIFRVSELFLHPLPDFLVKFRFANLGLSGIGITNAVLWIERQSAVLREGVGSRSKQH